MKLDGNTLIGSSLIRDQRLAPQLENGIVALINSKILNPGDRLPPIVELAKDLNISHCTVEKVYIRLPIISEPGDWKEPQNCLLLRINVLLILLFIVDSMT